MINYEVSGGLDHAAEDGCLILIRGIPGSGKSTLAKDLARANRCIHIEADMYWYRNADRSYNFEFENLSRAHRWCLQTAEAFLAQDETVIVSNTNLSYQDAKPYIRFAKLLNKDIAVFSMLDNGYGSIHGVPEDVMAKMRARYEPHEEFMEKVIAYRPTGTEEVCGEQSEAGVSEGVQAISRSVRSQV